MSTRKPLYRRGLPVFTWAGVFFYPPAGKCHKPTSQTSPARMDPAWMKNASVTLTYSSTRKIFLQGRPLETWHSHARRPATTLPTRFSIKQANNTIPTPINKWSFLNKVVYTQPLAEATHHNLMASCSGRGYSTSILIIQWNETGAADEPLSPPSMQIHLVQHRLRSGSILWFIGPSDCDFPVLSHSSILSQAK